MQEGLGIVVWSDGAAWSLARDCHAVIPHPIPCGPVVTIEVSCSSFMTMSSSLGRFSDNAGVGVGDQLGAAEFSIPAVLEAAPDIELTLPLVWVNCKLDLGGGRGSLTGEVSSQFCKVPECWEDRMGIGADSP